MLRKAYRVDSRPGWQAADRAISWGRTNQRRRYERWANHFESVVQDIPGILEVNRMGGEVDYLIKAVVRDMAGYDKLYQQLIRADLFDVSASFVMEEIKQTTELPI
ncbi:Lrp/AsnC ligand binding domain-containing protein [Pseudohalioglobus sediminis]|uniref:Lrp/AsnC ligand binding domain-containing protein n=1 Tax=Pseudohalioglobus sediminis TaxID=2606449 RepID=UPI0021CF7370|nr:Lrp/AsnC ligand binding domain-containing protein [Pseudohalioglobus sediminis]